MSRSEIIFLAMTALTTTMLAQPSTMVAQGSGWPPTAGHMTMPIWPGAAPGAPTNVRPEADLTTAKDNLIAGRPLIRLGNVVTPTITLYKAKGAGSAAGPAIVVFSGGGYNILAIDLEGTEVCDWLTGAGVNCVLLKYRVPDTGPYPKSSAALQDAQRAIQLVRLHGKEWGVDTHAVGILGFSAGGHLVAATSTQFERRLYSPVDAADAESCRPDFAVAIYPGHLSFSGYASDRKVGGHAVAGGRPPGNGFEISPVIHVTARTPPTFLLQAEDDGVDGVENSLAYYAALKQAGVPTELHLYAQGGHAFGLRPTQQAITAWPQLVETWLRTIGMISE